MQENLRWQSLLSSYGRKAGTEGLSLILESVKSNHVTNNLPFFLNSPSAMTPK